MLNFGLIIQFIFVFGLIVFVHEFGHFLIAKWWEWMLKSLVLVTRPAW